MRPAALLVAAACHFLVRSSGGGGHDGGGLLRDEAISPAVVIALFSAVLWNLATWYIGLPSSSSHALIGGLLGAAVLSGGLEVVRIDGLTKILLALLVSPPIGLLAGFLVMRLTLFAAQKAHPKVNHLFRRLQSLTLVALALSHGTNDAQKTMGVIAMGLLAAGYIERFVVPVWVIAAAPAPLRSGPPFGGWRLIRTLGARSSG
jgi:PiT family inorganic phosphate transporter